MCPSIGFEEQIMSYSQSHPLVQSSVTGSVNTLIESHSAASRFNILVDNVANKHPQLALRKAQISKTMNTLCHPIEVSQGAIWSNGQQLSTLMITLDDCDGRKVSTEHERNTPVMTNEDADQSEDVDQGENDQAPLIDRADVSLTKQESELVDRLIEGEEYDTSISANEMERALVEADIDDENREATTDDLVHAFRHRTSDAE